MSKHGSARLSLSGLYDWLVLGVLALALPAILAATLGLRPIA